MTKSIIKMNKIVVLLCMVISCWLMCGTAVASEDSPQFSDYPVPVYPGAIGRLNLTAKQAFQYRTRLRAAAAQPINFGGHYQLAEWGCGTDCTAGAIIDVLTGSVWFLPSADGSGMDVEVEGYKPLTFRPDSDLLIYTGAVNEDETRKGWHYFLFATGTLKEIKFVEWHPKANADQAPATQSIVGEPAVAAPEQASVATQAAPLSSAPPVDLQKRAAASPNAVQAATSTSNFTTRARATETTTSQPATVAESGGATVASGLLLLAIPGGAIALIMVLVERNRKRRRERIFKAAYETATQHMRALVRKRFQTLRHDDYGNLLEEPWNKELRYFMENVVDPIIARMGANDYGYYLTSMRPALLLTVANMVAESAGSGTSFTLGPNLTPTDFEQYCAQELRAAGWFAFTTKGSGDQGTDIVAEKDGLRLVIQCKLYSHPVGNKAVQEIAAARAHEQADCAAVVTNSKYTDSAKQLAATNGILLLHHSDLRNIGEHLTA